MVNCPPFTSEASQERRLSNAMSLASKRVVVTGAEGFIGSHLVEALCAKGASVRALCQYNSSNDWGWLESHSRLSELDIVTGDIRDPHFCLDLVKSCDYIFHLAALIPIPYSYRAPSSFVDTNINGTLNLCQAAVRHGVEKFLHVSTSEVYGTARYVPIDEEHPLCGQSPYSASKMGADAIALSFYYAFALPVVVARPFNTYGPRQSARAVIPTIISQLAARRTEVRLGALSTTRDFSFVTDTCSGIIAAATAPNGAGEVFNIGSGSEISVGDLARLIARLMDVPLNLTDDPERHRPEKSEVQRLLCNAGKLAAATGHAPEICLSKGLAITIEWFLDPSNLRRYKVDLYNV